MGAVPAEQLDEWQAGKYYFGTGHRRNWSRAKKSGPVPTGPLR